MNPLKFIFILLIKGIYFFGFYFLMVNLPDINEVYLRVFGFFLLYLLFILITEGDRTVEVANQMFNKQNGGGLDG